MQPHNRGKSHATIRRPILSSREWVVLNPIAAARHTLANWHLLGSINDESVLRVLSFLDGRSLAAVGQVCKHLRGMASDDAMWLQACRAEWGVSPDHLSRNHAPVEGKQLYFFAIQSMRTYVLTPLPFLLCDSQSSSWRA
ncbi:hypothetical protein AaE_011023 [Aphanomyces astaci]|uniref:F-box domain-containing protein n=1 Tax=Aphanomyces astaci TaxID=112090 RepID=A0A6A4ZVS5_APHAT|nr:hypothetical protein AaE_011023 [Aphanomyces astaci]